MNCDHPPAPPASVLIVETQGQRREKFEDLPDSIRLKRKQVHCEGSTLDFKVPVATIKALSFDDTGTPVPPHGAKNFIIEYFDQDGNLLERMEKAGQ